MPTSHDGEKLSKCCGAKIKRIDFDAYDHVGSYLGCSKCKELISFCCDECFNSKFALRGKNSVASDGRIICGLTCECHKSMQEDAVSRQSPSPAEPRKDVDNSAGVPRHQPINDYRRDQGLLKK